MKLASIPSPKNSIAIELQQVRRNTLDLLGEIDRSLLATQVHPDFSPIGWHFGHIAFTEAYWILEHLANLPPSFKEYHCLFSADGLPKSERQNLPSISIIQEYLGVVRQRVLEYLESAPTKSQERLWRWLIQHEGQHCETITLLWQLHRQQSSQNSPLNFNPFNPPANSENSIFNEMVKVEAGEFIMGSNDISGLDNEHPPHKIHLNTYWIDRFPVTCGQYWQFMTAGGYQKRQYWSIAGWQWLQQNPVSQPLYWINSLDWIDHPVCGVSYYEAEAYAKFVDKRLPTEAEWSKSALGASLNCNRDRAIGHTTPVNAYSDRSKYGCQDMLGNVWEWTASWFEGYSGFESYPYPGYSEVYFDNKHRVLKGGSWATSRQGMRTSFRNWYYPQVRQIFAGFRCAR
ncbi:SUMF1/EgtB/PvdO family nonheme iron enzyme [Waterburya agarophytonicola]|uniref:SUMF1/EgtB/PvdO family nonheme iron enzyme n=1 Tax=Waterburya agarophytonicola TaxID=2886916 RepID=UPI001E56AE63|nr:SUMF1/EgtB/PvdO family nonheme iron enzyme [Waterburya agarophytonicola]